MTSSEKIEIRDIIISKIAKTESAIEELKELTKPISPENAIGRISRMDAINNRSVNVAALRQAEQTLLKLNNALENIDQEDFGKCSQCGKEIQIGRIKFRPESAFCMGCVRR
ncbi:MAG: TraR/DksA family transcriptional regulator [Bacteroidia bacterium]